MLPETLRSRAGAWRGTNRLWLSTGQPPHESASEATLGLVAGGRFATLAYTWSFEGQSHDGLMLLGVDAGGAIARATWVDSFHQGGTPMVCDGSCDAHGVFSVTGRYAAPPGPDWGWRIEVDPGAESFALRMYNIAPAGEASLAVEAVYARKG